MKISINDVVIYETTFVEDVALDWRLIDKVEWFKAAVAEQISHAKSQMITSERNRIKGMEIGTPTSLGDDDLILWLASQPNYMTAAQREEVKKNLP